MHTDGRAEFALGIFGSWGSGKTTLMQAIKHRLDGDERVVPVWFAAWRYEREGSLLYITRGIRTSRVPLRFMSPPEVSLLTLRRETSSGAARPAGGIQVS